MTGQQGVFQGVMVVCDIARDGGMVGGWMDEMDGAGGWRGTAGGGAHCVEGKEVHENKSK